MTEKQESEHKDGSIIRSNGVYQDHDDDTETTALLSKTDRRVHHHHAKSKWRPIKQLLVLSVVYMLGYSPLSTLLNLESILNPEIGIYALLCNFGGSVCSLITAPLIANRLGAKGSVLLGWVCQAVFIGVHFYVEPYIILPVAFVVGIGHAQCWITNAVFVTTLALQYSQITNRPQGEVMGLFQGIFFTVFQINGMLGNLVSSLVLTNPADDTNGNGTTEHARGGNLSALCGKNFCPWEDTSGTYITQPDQVLVYIILGCFLGMVVLAFFTALLFLEDVEATAGDSLHSVREFLVSVGRLVFKKKLALMLPPFTMMAFGQIIILTEFIKAFVSCEIGIQYNGWTAMFYSGGQILGAAISSHLPKHVGWAATFILAACCNVACLASILLYQPSGIDSLVFFFLIPFFWASVDSVWLTTSSAYVGHVFPDQKWPVFVTARSAIYVMFAVVYSYSNFVCMEVKVYIALAVTGLALMSSLAFLGITRNWETKSKLKY